MCAPLLSFNPVVPLMTPEPPPGLAPIGPGHPMADIVHLAEGCDIRPALTTYGPRSDGGPPVIEMWVRPRDVAPDVLFALMCGDVSAPVTFAVNRTGWAPTVQLTAYLRALPADGWLAGDVHHHADRPGLVRRGPRRRRLRRPHHRADPAAGDGACAVVFAGVQCFHPWPESRLSAVEVSGEALLSGLLRAGRQVKDMVVAERDTDAREVPVRDVLGAGDVGRRRRREREVHHRRGQTRRCGIGHR